MKEVKMRIYRREIKFQEEGREWRLPSVLYANDLVFFCESVENMRAMVGCFI